MTRKFLYVFYTILFTFSSFAGFVIPVQANDTPVSVVIDGAAVDFGSDQQPVIADTGRTLVPLRKIFEVLGADIKWDDATKTVTATKDTVKISLTIDNTTATKNDQPITLDQAPVIIGGRTMVPVRFIGEALGATVKWVSDTRSVTIDTSGKKSYKVLAIGNSFSQDATRYLNQIAKANDVDLYVGNLVIGGCSLATHWSNANGNKADYSYEVNGSSTGKKLSIKDALESNDWDFVTMQQVSNNSGKENTFYPYIENLAKYIKTIEPQAELLIHQTWAYEKGSDHTAFPNYNNDQETMFNALTNAYQNAAAKVGALTLDDGTPISKNGAPLRIIPDGQAMQNARKNPVFDTTMGDGKTVRLNRDGYHASLNHGRYLLGAVWYECITGNLIEESKYVPAGIVGGDLDILNASAHFAVAEYGW